jgi:hypothetical protein
MSRAQNVQQQVLGRLICSGSVGWLEDRRGHKELLECVKCFLCFQSPLKHVDLIEQLV